LSQDSGGVSVEVHSGDGPPSTFRAQYLVGADGGRSTVRKLLGINLLGHTHEWRWLVVDIEDDDRFAPFSGVYCHPKRPHMSIDLPYGFRRFEFRLMQDESDEEMQKPEAVQRLLAPHFAKAASPRIKRSRIYQHHSRIAERFQSGRVFLAGDAAHLQPPFFGQGMNSGLRDATNLSWKLAAVVKGRASPDILESYDRERRDHATRMVKFATSIGSFYAPKNFVTEALRTAFFRIIQGLPGARDYILQMKFKPLPRYLDGIVAHQGAVDERSPVGRMFLQPLVETAQRKRVKLDDAIGNWFSIIGVNKDPARYLGQSERDFWTDNGASLVQVVKSRSNPARMKAAPGTVILDDVTGTFRDWIMARPSDEFIFLRPDRYVGAVCDASGLDQASRQLRLILQGVRTQARAAAA
jgi:3-(3-hydroxy-phenyl)propionate hydroxylase